MINAIDYPSIQAAVDALGPSGGTVFIQKGTYNATSTPCAFTGVTLGDSVVLQGEGSDCTILEQTNANADVIVGDGNAVEIRDLIIRGAGSAGTGHGIHLKHTTTYHLYVAVRRCVIERMPKWGVYVDPQVEGANRYTAPVILEDVKIGDSNIDTYDGGSVYIGDNIPDAAFIRCTFNARNVTGVFQSPYATPAFDIMPMGAVHAVSGSALLFLHCHWEAPHGTCFSCGPTAWDVIFRDCFIEVDGTVGRPLFSIAAGIQGFRIDGLDVTRYDTDWGIRLLQEDKQFGGEGGLLRNIICKTNVKATVIPTDDVIIGNGDAEWHIENCKVTRFTAPTGLQAGYWPLRIPASAAGNSNRPRLTKSRQDGRGRFPSATTAQRDNADSASFTNFIAKDRLDGDMIYNLTTQQHEVYKSGIGWQAGLLTLAKSADQSNSTTTAADITDLTVALAANDVIRFHAYLVASAASTGTGIQLAVNGPTGALPDATIIGWTNATTQATLGVNGLDVFQTNSNSAGSTKRVFEIFGRMINAGTAGTFALRFKSETGGSEVKIHRGSWLQYFKGAN